MVNSEREKVWRERVGQWKASGLSQRAYAIEHRFPIRQVGYLVRRLTKAKAQAREMPALLPVRVAAATSQATINLRGERWSLTLPNDVPASWLAELVRAL